MSFNVCFQVPSNILLTGPSQSGKTSFLKKLLAASGTIFSKKPQKVFYFYAARQPIIDEMLKDGLIHKAFHNLPQSYEMLVNLVRPYRDTGRLREAQNKK